MKKKSSNSRAGKKFKRRVEKVFIGLAIALGVVAPAPADDLWANSPPGSRTNASTPREVSWTDPEAVERRHITLQPSLPKEPSPDRDVRV